MDMLAYLITFYDLPYNTWRRQPASNDDASSDDDIVPSNQSYAQYGITIEDAVRYQSDRAVDHLEGILGLNYENFYEFQ